MDKFTSSLATSISSDDACLHCGKNNQWVSHGYTHKQNPADQPQMSGKRILCSNRYGKSGCGRTRQLYLAEVIPRRRYGLCVVIAFIQALLNGVAVEQSYITATQGGAKEARHAWRWLRDLFTQLSLWRTLLLKPSDVFVSHGRSKTLKHVLPTVARLLKSSGVNPLRTFQVQHQLRFF